MALLDSGFGRTAFKRGKKSKRSRPRRKKIGRGYRTHADDEDILVELGEEPVRDRDDQGLAGKDFAEELLLDLREDERS